MIQNVNVFQFLNHVKNSGWTKSLMLINAVYRIMNPQVIILACLTVCLSALAVEPPLSECAPRDGLPNSFAKLRHGDTVRIGYLGGSITAQEGWRPKSLNWFRQKYPAAKISEINAAIGGTGSDLGAFRLRHDVLSQKPDLLFVEFAVNDGGAPAERIYRGMEGIVRQVWRDNPDTDICFVYTIDGNMLKLLQKGELPSSYAAMEKVAAHYEIPSIMMGLEVMHLEQAGKVIFRGAKPKTEDEKAKLGDKILFSGDGVHPYTDSGHQLYFEALVRGMNLIEPVGQPAPHKLMNPFIVDNWENAKLLPLDCAKLSGGWVRLDPATNTVARSFLKQLPGLWKANQAGDTIEFKFRGTAASLYDVIGPGCGQVIITLDDQKPEVKQLFDVYCTYYRLSLLSIGAGLSNTVHSVKIEIHPDQPDKAKILGAGKMDDPKRFNDRICYAAALMIVGELVESQ
jgi:hypothetical protein